MTATQTNDFCKSDNRGFQSFNYVFMKQKILSLVFLLCLMEASAQEENAIKAIDKNPDYSLLYAGVELSSTAAIDTKSKDSNIVNLYLSPYVDYNHKSGLGLRVSGYVLPGGSDPGFYLAAISPYFSKYNGKILPFISYTRYIQNNNPSVPYSPIQHEVYAHLRVKTKFIDPMVGIDVGFGNNEQNNNEPVSDINAFAALTHNFILENKGAGNTNLLAIKPRLQLNAGTDRYFKFLRSTKYISQNTKAKNIGYGSGRNRGNGDGNTGSTAVINTIISEENSFNVSNAEANLYLMYFFGKFSVEPSGSLYFPLRGDDRKAYGYWQVSLNYWFK